MGLEMGTTSFIVACIVCVRSVTTVLKASLDQISVGCGMALRRSLRCIANSFQSVALKLGRQVYVLGGTVISSSLIIGRWSVCGGQDSGAVVHFMKASSSSDK